MPTQFISHSALWGGMLLVSFSLGDYLRNQGFEEIPPLSEVSHNFVVFALGLVLLCLAGILTQLDS